MLLASHDLPLLERHCDEVVVMEAGRVIERGDPVWCCKAIAGGCCEPPAPLSTAVEMQPSSRHGDERASDRADRGARCRRPFGLDHRKRPATRRCAWSCAIARAVARAGSGNFDPQPGRESTSTAPTPSWKDSASVRSPLERQIELLYRFAAALCPGEYTLTVASHDPDGAAHEWLEDAIRFTVGDSRYTAGVANLTRHGVEGEPGAVRTRGMNPQACRAALVTPRRCLRQPNNISAFAGAPPPPDPPAARRSFSLKNRWSPSGASTSRLPTIFPIQNTRNRFPSTRPLLRSPSEYGNPRLRYSSANSLSAAESIVRRKLGAAIGHALVQASASGCPPAAPPAHRATATAARPKSCSSRARRSPGRSSRARAPACRCRNEC